MGLLARIRWFLACLTDRQTPWTGKLLVAVALLYMVLPFDLLADTVPVLGWFDDATVALILGTLAYRLVPKEVAERLAREIGGKKS